MYFEWSEENAKYYPSSCRFCVTLDVWIRSWQLLYFVFILELLTMPFALIWIIVCSHITFSIRQIFMFGIQINEKGIVIRNAREIRKKRQQLFTLITYWKNLRYGKRGKTFRHVFSFFPKKPRHFISSHCSCKETCPAPPPPGEKVGKLATQA